MKKRILLMAVAGVLMTASAAAFAHGYYGHGYYRHGYYYGGPRVVIGVPWGPPPPQTYIEKPPSYAYYCRRPAGYYPQVPRCPDGWMKVVPDGPLSR